jgi:outer membrane protein assembly factor BamE (lipoprotein component of BamABCDE complex)
MRRFFSRLGRTVKWALILGALVIVILVIVALVSLGNAGQKSEKSARQVSPAKYAAVKQGMRKSQVRAILGRPESTDQTQVSGLTEECWYYGVLAASATYQFCFSNGRLDVKARY